MWALVAAIADPALAMRRKGAFTCLKLGLQHGCIRVEAPGPEVDQAIGARYPDEGCAQHKPVDRLCEAFAARTDVQPGGRRSKRTSRREEGNDRPTPQPADGVCDRRDRDGAAGARRSRDIGCQRPGGLCPPFRASDRRGDDPAAALRCTGLQGREGRSDAALPVQDGERPLATLVAHGLPTGEGSRRIAELVDAVDYIEQAALDIENPTETQSLGSPRCFFRTLIAPGSGEPPRRYRQLELVGQIGHGHRHAGAGEADILDGAGKF